MGNLETRWPAIVDCLRQNFQAAVDVLGCPSPWAETGLTFLDGRCGIASLSGFSPCSFEGFYRVGHGVIGVPQLIVQVQGNGLRGSMIAALGQQKNEDVKGSFYAFCLVE